MVNTCQYFVDTIKRVYYCTTLLQTHKRCIINTYICGHRWMFNFCVQWSKAGQSNSTMKFRYSAMLLRMVLELMPLSGSDAFVMLPASKELWQRPIYNLYRIPRNEIFSEPSTARSRGFLPKFHRVLRLSRAKMLEPVIASTYTFYEDYNISTANPHDLEQIAASYARTSSVGDYLAWQRDSTESYTNVIDREMLVARRENRLVGWGSWQLEDCSRGPEVIAVITNLHADCELSPREDFMLFLITALENIARSRGASVAKVVLAMTSAEAETDVLTRTGYLPVSRTSSKELVYVRDISAAIRNNTSSAESLPPRAGVKGAQERIDVITTSGMVVGTYSRAFVERHNLLHRAIGVLVHNAEGEIYVHRRSACKSVHPSHYDMFVGGLVLAGEEPQVAAQNELLEELGIPSVAASPCPLPVPTYPLAASQVDPPDTQMALPPATDSICVAGTGAGEERVVEGAKWRGGARAELEYMFECGFFGPRNRVLVHVYRAALPSPSPPHHAPDAPGGPTSGQDAEDGAKMRASGRGLGAGAAGAVEVVHRDGEVEWGRWCTLREVEDMVGRLAFVPGGLKVWHETLARGLHSKYLSLDRTGPPPAAPLP